MEPSTWETRQTLNAPGIKYEYIDEVNKFIKDYIKGVDVEMCDVDMEVNDAGYPTIGARNVMSCIGNAHCIKGNVNTYKLARKIEKLVFPSHYHIKVAVAGCPNDCVKGQLQRLRCDGRAQAGVRHRTAASAAVPVWRPVSTTQPAF